MEALLPMAGFANPQNGSCTMSMAYKMPRGRSVDICDIRAIKNDNDYSSVIEHIMPGSIERLERSKKAYHGRSENSNDPQSISNLRFCEFCIAATTAWIQDAVIMTEKYPILLQREPYLWLEESPIKSHWTNIKEKVGKAGEEIQVDLNEVLEDRRVAIAHFDNVAEKLLSTMSTNFMSVHDEIKALKDEVESTESSKLKQSFHCMLQSMVPQDVEVVYRHTRSGQILETPGVARLSSSSSSPTMSRAAGQMVARSSSSTRSELVGTSPGEGPAGPSTLMKKNSVSSTRRDNPTMCLYNLKKPGEHQPEYVKSMVMEWHNIIIPIILNKQNGSSGQQSAWYEKSQKQLKEKHQLLYDAIKHSISAGEDDDEAAVVRKLRFKCNDLQKLVDENDGCFTDVEVLCRHAKNARKKGQEFDITDEQKLKEIIMTRKEKQKRKREERRNQK